MRRLTVLSVLTLGLTACVDSNQTATSGPPPEATTDENTIMGRDAGCFILLGPLCPRVDVE